MNETDSINQLLKGTYMGISIFENLKERLKSEMLKKEFTEIINTLQIHQHSLIALLKSKKLEIAEHTGVMGTITEIVEDLKSKILDSDYEVLEAAIYNIKMAEKAILVYDEEHFLFDDGIIKILRIMKQDYMSIYHKLNRYLIEFER